MNPTVVEYRAELKIGFSLTGVSLSTTHRITLPILASLQGEVTKQIVENIRIGLLGK